MQIHLLTTCTSLAPWDDVFKEEISQLLPHGVEFPVFDWLMRGKLCNHDFILEDSEAGVFRAIARNLVTEYRGNIEPCLYLTGLSSFSMPFRPPETHIRTLPSAIRSLNAAVAHLDGPPSFVVHTIGLEGRASFERKHLALCGWLRRRDLVVREDLSRLVQVPERSNLGSRIKRLLSEEMVAKYAAARAIDLGFEEAYRGDAFGYFLAKLVRLREDGLQIPQNLSQQQADALAVATFGSRI